MEQEPASEFDVVVIGSGAAALMGALTAADAGHSVLVLEKTAAWGGTTACSGGGIWLPDHPLMADVGVEDSREAAMTYLDSVVGDAGPATSPERKAAFIDTAPELAAYLLRLGMRLEATLYPDYYPQHAGSRVGRGLASQLIDGRVLGEDLATLRVEPHPIPVVCKRDEFLALVAPFRRKLHLLTIAKIVARTLKWKLRGRAPLYTGRSTMAELMRLARSRGMEMLLNSDVQALERTGARVDTVLFRQNGEQRRVKARKGVLIAAGGFARNDALRRRYQAVGDAFTATAPGDTGTPIEAAMTLGADVDLMEESWWMPVVMMPDGTRSITLMERSMPHGLMVDQQARRYLNEAQPYCNCGAAMLDHAGPTFSWLILDSRHRNNYAFANLVARQNPREWLEGGHMLKARSIAELARQADLDPIALQATIDRFNGFARKGEDEDFGRGGSRFDNGWGDPWNRPNPNLGTVERAPFYAVKIWPGDLGTKGGLLTDNEGRVLDHAGLPMPGLYAAGNSSATMMGRCYPGPGATLGAGMVFAYRAMRHAGQEARP